MLSLLDAASAVCLPASRPSGSAARSDESASIHLALCALLIECSDLVAEDAAHRFAAPSSLPASSPLAALCLIMRWAAALKACYSYAHVSRSRGR